ncbi:hypothetical protein N7509_001669 [Penicillium cosmopolitanum]|uniref:INO80 complex subunit F domain-containing protein n=1 Tax=Penicillium cosmopolitanum TaxID=1131564 RepID=A0A9W9W7G3_9EURO|nr:uncharacterized protein N7509_001669 [Penicillium cosmopolitanum]KAJ5407786.1 hypothetical protein N7509_001669 [Penicillium cosmopolitanum]
MEARPPTSAPSLNPPSVEIAYKRKCIALKKRLAEVEAENELMRTRNRRGWQYIQKMRLESCMLLERLAKVTGMTEEAQAGAADPELRARAVAMMSNVASINGMSGGASGRNGPSLEDETEGSSDEQPPTPEDRPLRIKRSRKSNVAGEQGEDDGQAQDNAAESADPAALPRLAPAPSQQDLSSSFRVQAGSGAEGDDTPAAASTHSQDNREEGQSEQPAESADQADSGTTPMDMDAKEPKIEG